MIATAVETYLAVRRAAGYQLRDQGALLESFARFADARRDGHVKAATAHAWAALGSTPGARERRLQTLIPFARHARSDDARHEVPAGHLFGHVNRRPTPFIYTDEPIGQILDQAAKLGPVGSFVSRTYRTLFGLLAVTGLRVSEALALTVSDLAPDGLIIRMTKFRKSRLVPVHPSVAAEIVRHMGYGARAATNHIFTTKPGRPLPYREVWHRFRCILQAAGIGRAPGGPRPTIHSLRHTFAVRALETCPRDPVEIAHHMVALATYLGHVHISSTYWYLQATPRVSADIADACEAFARGRSR